MCDPISLGVVATVATVAGGGFDAYNQYKQGVAESKYQNYLAGQEEQQGKSALASADRQSTNIQTQAKEQGKNLKSEQAQLSAKQRVALAASGAGGGATAEDIVNDTFSRQKADEFALRYNADLRSNEAIDQGNYSNWGSQTRAEQHRYAGKNAKSAAKARVFSTLLSTAASTAGMFGGAGGGSAKAIKNTGYYEGRM